MASTPRPASGAHSCQSFKISFNIRLCAGIESIFRSVIRPDHRISERTDSAHADFDHVPGRKRTHARRSAGGNEVTRLERHHLRDETDYNIKGKDHFGRVSILFPGTVHESLDRGIRQIERSFKNRAEGAEGIEAFGAGELDVELLQIARGDFVQAGVAENVG